MHAHQVRDLSGNLGFQLSFVALFVVAYPAIVLGFGEIEVPGKTVSGLPASAIAAAINAFYCFLVVWVIVGLGLDRVGSWAIREFWANRTVILVGLVRGLPLLLGIGGLALLTAELWHVVATVSRTDFTVVLGILALLSLAFMVTTSAQEVASLSAFERWQDVRSSATLGTPGGAAPEDSPGGKVVTQLDTATPPDPPQAFPLKGAEWINAFAVVAVYQVLIFVPVMVGALLLFWQLGKRVVPPEVAAEWVFGDGTPAREGVKLRERDGYDDPWTRVTIVLTAFSVLYYAIQVLSNRDEYFFKGADRTLKRRFAVRLAHKGLDQRETRAANRGSQGNGATGIAPQAH